MENKNILNDEEIKIAFGSSLRELRECLNMTQKDLAEAVDVPRQSLSVYERGETAPTIIQAYKIAKFFNLCIDDFIIYGAGKQEKLLGEEFSSIVDKYNSLGA